MIHLALETSTRLTSACLADSGKILADSGLDDGVATINLLGNVQKLMTDSDLTLSAIQAIVVSVGPGSFTGLRLGLSTAKTLAYAINCPVIPVSTHDILAYQAAKALQENGKVGIATRVVTAIDAQRGQWFVETHQRLEKGAIEGEPEPTGPTRRSRIVFPQEFIDSLPQSKTLICGTGLKRHLKDLDPPTHIQFAPQEFWTPQARAAVELVAAYPDRFESASPFDIKPEYGRKSAAEEKLEKSQPRS